MDVDDLACNLIATIKQKCKERNELERNKIDDIVDEHRVCGDEWACNYKAKMYREKSVRERENWNTFYPVEEVKKQTYPIPPHLSTSQVLLNPHPPHPSTFTSKMAQYSVINPIVFFGNGGVGKTNLINRLCGLHFESRYIASVGFNITPIMNEGEVFADFVDTAGQEMYGSYSPEMIDILNKAKVAVFVIDNTSKLNSKNIQKWVKKANLSTDVKVLLVQTKTDIGAYSKSFLTDNDRTEIMTEMGVETIHMVDSKTGTGIQTLEQAIWSIMQ